MKGVHKAETDPKSSLLIIKDMESQHRTLLELLDDDSELILSPDIIKLLKIMSREFMDYLKLADKRMTLLVLYQELIYQLFDAQGKTLIEQDEQRKNALAFVFAQLQSASHLANLA